ncbi:MAG: DUF4878 domain-containing protein [Lentisphaerae bacterium]|nr:DUF4878 domain-containing protein [Lentisphaerota bacterium]
MKKIKFAAVVIMAVSALSFAVGKDIAAAGKNTLQAKAAAEVKKAAAKIKKPTTPAETIAAFYTAMAKSDFAEAKKYVKADELKKMIGTLADLVKEMPEFKADVAKDFAPMLKGKCTSEKITGNKAEIVFTYKEKGKDKKETYKLEKTGNNWIIVD